MCFVDEAEVAFEAVDDRGVGAEERAVSAQQVLQRRLPPGPFELGAHLLLGDVTHRELGEERLEAEPRELGAQGRPLDEVVEDIRFGGEFGERPHQLRHRDRAERVGARATEDLVELGEVGVDALPRDLHVGEAERHLGDDTGLDVAVPLGALLLDAQERLVHVDDVHAGADVLAGKPLQPAPVRRVHRRRVATRTVRLNQIAERPLEHGRAEPVERIADAREQPQLNAELGDALERPHVGLAHHRVAALQQGGNVGAVQAGGEAVRTTGVGGGGERDAEPRRVVGAEAELAQSRRGREFRGGLAPLARQADERADVEPRGGRRGRVEG